LAAGPLTLDDYAVACVESDINGSSQARVKSAIEGLLINSYRSLALDQDDRAAALRFLAQKVWNKYRQQIPDERWPVMGIAPLDSLSREVLDQLLDPEKGFPPDAQAVLRTKLGLPAAPAPKPAETSPTPSANAGK